METRTLRLWTARWLRLRKGPKLQIEGAATSSRPAGRKRPRPALGIGRVVRHRMHNDCCTARP
eukprot:12719203-Alexandrium_andersonii.AAC.1